jgi:hypothetical protein
MQSYTHVNSGKKFTYKTKEVHIVLVLVTNQDNCQTVVDLVETVNLDHHHRKVNDYLKLALDVEY